MDILSVLNNEKGNKDKVVKYARRAVSFCLIACALIFITQILIAVIAVFLLKRFPVEFFYTNLGSIVIDIPVYVLGILIPLLITTLLFNKFIPKSDFELPKRYTTRKPILYVVGTIGVGYLVTMFMNVCFKDFVERFSAPSEVIANTPIEIFLNFFLYAFLPAVLEELMFRGLLLKRLLPYGKHGAIFISAFLFGLVHIDPPRIIFATVFGMLIGYCYEYTGSLAMPMIIHFINNSISVAGSLVGEDLIAASILSFVIIGFAITGIVFIINISINGIKKHKVSINKPLCIGYKLSMPKYASLLVLNAVSIPFIVAFIYCFNLYF